MKHCDLAKINEETYQITELICRINNQKLRDDMLKIKEPTLEQLVTLGNSYDTSAHIQKATFGEEASANRVQSKYKKTKFNNNRNKAQDNNYHRNNPSILHPRNVRLVEDHHVEKATLEQPAKKTPNKTRPLSNLSRFDLSTLTKTILNPLQHVTWHL